MLTLINSDIICSHHQLFISEKSGYAIEMSNGLHKAGKWLALLAAHYLRSEYQTMETMGL